jgi:diguanylate cyclase (GGDEF)-like protein/PAS domain S-box-containing protein
MGEPDRLRPTTRVGALDQQQPARELEPLHTTLARQLRRLSLGTDQPPSAQAWNALVRTVSRAYREADEDRYLMERSQDLASSEMAALNEALRRERDLLEQRVQERTAALSLSEARLRSLVSLSSDWIWEQDTKGHLTYLSEGAAVAAGRPVAELIGRRAQDLDGFECEDRVKSLYLESLLQGRAFRHIVHGARAADGSMRYFSISGEPVLDDQGVCIGYRGVGSDVTLATLASRQLTLLARFDVLTGLPNRAQFIEELDRAVARARREDGRFALCFIDLDGFKQINDTRGHAAGDEVLKVVAQRLREQLRESDFVARLGGDEFVALLPGRATPTGLAKVGDKLLSAIGQPIAYEERDLLVKGSIGIAMYPQDSTQAGALMEQADAAMYLAKQAGKNQVRFYTGELARTVAQQFALELDLKQTFTQGGLELHFQPRCSLADGRLSGMEALVRWNHPQRGLVPPSEFIALAEERGLILQLGRWVLDAACRQIRRWIDAGLTPPRCALNLSAHQLGSDALFDEVDHALARHGLQPAALEVELTEEVVTAQHGRADALLHRLHALGVRIAIDDFGIGTSSLAMLRRVPAHALKVDRSLIGRLPEAEALAVTRAAIALAHGLGLKAVAEGVESEAILGTLRELGCDEAQGYLLGRPMPADAFAARLAG